MSLLSAARWNCSPLPLMVSTEAIRLAHGFTIDLLVELVGAGLATAKAERVIAGGRAVEVARLKITEAGRRAMADRAK